VVVIPMSGPAREIAADISGADDVAWSPDGKTIAWLANVSPADPAGRRVLSAPAEGGAARAVGGAGTGSLLHVGWTGDGRLSLAIEGNQERHIDVLDARTNERVTVMPPGIAFVIGRPSWSADGSRYAVVGSTPEHLAEVFAGSLPQPPPRGRDSVGAPPPPVRRITFSNR
jgi:WD40 repeat protein